MNREEIIRMAREAGFRTGELHMQDGSGSWAFVTPIGDGCIVELERFAALVGAAEREACANVAELESKVDGMDNHCCVPLAKGIAEAIRDRSHP